MSRDAELTREDKSRRSPNLVLAAGVFLVVLAVYVATSPGRIDIIDGQIRYEMTQNLIRWDRPYLLDPALTHYRKLGYDGSYYSDCGPAASLFALPLVWFADLLHNPRDEVARFWFSLASPIFGALLAAVLFLFYAELGLSKKRALAWTLVSSFATLVWPLAASSFENVQRAFFVLTAVFLGHVSSKRTSNLLAVCAGLAAGVLVLYREFLLALIPALALSVLRRTPDSQESTEGGGISAPSARQPVAALIRRVIEWACAEARAFSGSTAQARGSRARFMKFVEGAGVGLAASLAYYLLRFGTVFTLPPAEPHPLGPPPFGNPVAGLLTLLASPGKSILLYSPPIILGFWGIRQLGRREPYLLRVIIAASLIVLLGYSCYSAVGGDWCWGPRYLVALLPLWALAFPFVPRRRLARVLGAAIIGWGLMVQLMALAVDHQRFFFQLRLSPTFYAGDAWFYFKHSALLTRPSEIASLKDGVPQTAHEFSPSPYPGLLTYCIFGPPARLIPQSDHWMRAFKVFYLPRPWPLWMRHIEPARRPINVAFWMMGCLGLALIGVSLVCWQLRQKVVSGESEELIPPTAADPSSRE